MTYQKLAECDGMQWPCNDDHPDGTTRLYTDRHFPTEWQRSESYEADLQTGHEHTLNEYRDKRDPRGRAVFVTAEYQPPLETTDEQFPAIAISGRLAYHWHTRTKKAKETQLKETSPRRPARVPLAYADEDGKGTATQRAGARCLRGNQ